ncbi:MAG: 30S ribosomal protein S15 [Caldimicrobium sp.]|jgi:small subunit ribosomal protein S15
MPLDPEIKKEIISRFQRHPQDTGSPEVQIALLTARIKQIEEHLKTHKKDFHCRRGLMKLIGQRRALLEYLKRTDFPRYQALIKNLGLKK